MKSVMTHSFSRVPKAEIQRSSFNRSHGYKTTFDADYIVPIFVDEALPGDTWNLKMSAFARLATPIFPIMDNMFMDTFFFSVPMRLIWNNWEKFCGEQVNPGDSIDYLVPTFDDGTTFSSGGIGDYLGIPVGVPLDGVRADFHRAYKLIHNEWFRDENLQNSAVFSLGDGPETLGVDISDSLNRRGKRHDYFTSCLPWPQKGDAVDIGIGATAPVVATGDFLLTNGTTTFDFDVNGSQGYQTSGPATQTNLDYASGLEVDLSAATAITINQLREAFQIQRLLERDARAGTRYTEIIRSHFGTISPDQRLQRPEFLGGGTQMINITQVPQTSSTDATTPQGNLAAYGTASFSGHGFVHSFTEHCIVLGFVNVRADLTYQQGLNRMFSRSTRYDFYWPVLAHLGEMAVLNKEIFAQGTADDDLVFGYQERFAEYRYKPSQLTGLMRSNVAGTLESWHLSQDFASLPVLNSTFILSNTPLDRVIAVPSEPHFILDAYFNFNCVRPMPIYSVPGLIDHF